MKTKLLYAAVCAIFVAGPISAAVTPEEAAKLGTTLTPFGAEPAGNADGSIPPYTGGIKKLISALPADFVPGSGVYPDPFKDEKPLYSINASNKSQYENFLTPGTAAVMARFPNYRVNVYPTHRTMAYPDWVLDNTKKNAVNATQTGEIAGDGVKGAWAGLPFPIPKDGYEVMWNNILRWNGGYYHSHFSAYLVDSNGRRTMLNETKLDSNYPYYDKTQDKPASDNYVFYARISESQAPASQAGVRVLATQTNDSSVQDVTTWAYLPGQRRVRMAPEQSYDTPASSFGGAINYDEIGLFSGRPDRFDFNLVGKKEIIIPYNAYQANSAKADDLYQKEYLNPDLVRWEKHRVWVVDAKLKPGKRHAFSRWTFYFDEDTWSVVATEAYDQSGKLYRVAFHNSYIAYDYPVATAALLVFYDLSKNSYVTSVGRGPNGQGHFKPQEKPQPMGNFTSNTLVRGGVR